MDTQVTPQTVNAAATRRDFWLAFACLPHRQAVVEAIKSLMLLGRVSVHAMVSDRLSPPIEARPKRWDWRKLPPAPRPRLAADPGGLPKGRR